MTFAADIRRWESVDSFAQHLAGYDPAVAPWASGVTLHHTYTPTLDQWRGLASVKGARDYYIGLGWNAGPHLFIAHGSHNPEWDGIYQLTPLNLQGIHAGHCNMSMWGIEIVGRYDAAPWPADLAEIVYGVTCALLRWRGLPANVQGHRECLPNKSCPGNAINMATVRDEIRYRLAKTPDTTQPGAALLTEDTPIISAPRATLEQCTKYMFNRAHTNYDEYDIGQVIVPRYFEVCQQVGVDPLVAIAQMIHETGNLCSALSARKDKDGRDLRNPAGIGVSESKDRATAHYRPGTVYDADVHGYRPCVSFRTWAADAIPAHVGRLLAYALPHSAWDDAQRELVSQALEYRPLASKLWGSAPTLKQLGKAHNPTGDGWASPGQLYGQQIAKIMNAIRGQG